MTEGATSEELAWLVFPDLIGLRGDTRRAIRNILEGRSRVSAACHLLMKGGGGFGCVCLLHIYGTCVLATTSLGGKNIGNHTIATISRVSETALYFI